MTFLIFFHDYVSSLMRHNRDGVLSLSSEDFPESNPHTLHTTQRRPSNASDRSDAGFGQSPRHLRKSHAKGSASDDTESLSSRSLNGSPNTSPVNQRKEVAKPTISVGSMGDLSDDERDDLKDSIMKRGSGELIIVITF